LWQPDPGSKRDPLRHVEGELNTRSSSRNTQKGGGGSKRKKKKLKGRESLQKWGSRGDMPGANLVRKKDRRGEDSLIQVASAPPLLKVNEASRKGEPFP